MASFIKKVTSLFSKVEQEKSSAVRSVKPRRKVKKNANSGGEETSLEQLKQDVVKNGYCTLQVKSLFRLYGYKQRGSTNVDFILNHLKREGLLLSKRIVLETAWSKKVRVYGFPVEQLGCLFDNEKEMEDAFAANHWHRQIGLTVDLTINETVYMSDRQFKPIGTKDRLDFKATDKEGNHVVVELKHKDGDNRLVEQALRYRTHLMNHYNTDRVRCVIITGIRCLHTAKALYALPLQEKEVIKWYVYNWDILRPGEISFVEVTYDFIAKHLTVDGNC